MKKKYDDSKTQVMFPETVVKRFIHRNKALRYGQAFHQYMKLEQIQGQDKSFCDRLYNAGDAIAKQMIISRTQFGQ